MAKVKFSTAQLIFPHQLFKDTDYLDKNQPVFLVEEFLFLNNTNFTNRKLPYIGRV